jgi:hypothetical protein
MTGRRIAGAAAVIAALGLAAWFLLGRADETTIITARLNTLATEINQSTVDGLGTAARALQLSSYFTDDVEIDLGQGSAPIRGRATVIGMAERLQPRTAAFKLSFQDITAVLDPGGTTATVHLTAEVARRSITTGESSLDAHEFSLGMRKVGGEWRIAQVTAVKVLK